MLSDDLAVTSDTLEINCGIDCNHNYLVTDGPKTVVLTAHPKAGWTFVGWAGSKDCRDDGDGNIFTAQVTVGIKDLNCNVVAYDTSAIVSLTVEKQGGGIVKAEALPLSDSSGIDCMFDICSQNYPVLTDVQLTATATRGSKFSGFSTQVGSNIFTGDVAENVCFDGQINLTGNLSCIATFNSSVLVVDGSNDAVPKESNEYIPAVQSVAGLDYRIWSVRFPNETSNPFGRAEPDAADLSKYGRVIWYSSNTVYRRREIFSDTSMMVAVLCLAARSIFVIGD